MLTAVLIDGAFFVKRFRKIEPHNAYSAERASELAFRYAISHLSEGKGDSRKRSTCAKPASMPRLADGQESHRAAFASGQPIAA